MRLLQNALPQLNGIAALEPAHWPDLPGLITMAGPEHSEDRDEPLACPYFMPLERMENGSWPHPARLPLAPGWRGYCTAPGHDGEVPQQSVLEAFCNLGYASACPWVPAQRVWDAVRFAVVPAENAKRREAGRTGSSPSAGTIRLRYVCERNHLPVTDGDLEFDLARASWVRRHDDPRLQKMAECFLESYLKRKP